MDVLKEFTGTIELELLVDGFCLVTSKRLPRAAVQEILSWPGAREESKRLCFEATAYQKVKDRLDSPSKKYTLILPPNWVLASIPSFRAYGQVRLQKKVAHVLRSDAKTEGLPELAASREGNPVLPYQRDAINFALSRGGRVLLGDEMGLGKTAQALTLAAQYPQDWPLLVVCPSSLRGNWREEAARWLPQSLLPVPEQHVQVIRKGSDKLNKKSRVIVVSYDLIAQNAYFCSTPFGKDYRIVICDEAHYLKSPDSKRSRTLRDVLHKARRCALLTGTPALAKASELYSPLDCLLPGLLPPHKDFCQRYCNEKVVNAGHRQFQGWEGSRLGDELYALLSECVMVRRMKTDVLNQLPEKRRQRVVLDKLSGGKEVLNELKEKMKDHQGKEAYRESEGGGGNGAPELFRLTGLAKVEAVADYIEYLILADCRFLLFAHHQSVMDTLQEKMKALKTPHIRIDGKTPTKKRDELVEDFRTKMELQVALLSITACGQGLNLQVGCSTVVFAELHWTPGVLLQAEDRVHRMGQKHSVNVHYLIAKDTLDDSMYQMLERKHQDVGVLLDGKASRLGAAQAPAGQMGDFSAADGEQVGPAPRKSGQQLLSFAAGKSSGTKSSQPPAVSADDQQQEQPDQRQDEEAKIEALPSSHAGVREDLPPSGAAYPEESVITIDVD